MTEKILSQAELLATMRQGWEEFYGFLQGLTVEELTEPTDAVGWAVKDHIMHCAVWEDGIFALLERQSREDYMGFDVALWDQGVDIINDVIWKQHRDKPLDEVMQTFQDAHQRLVNKIETLTDEDLARPYSYYQAHAPFDKPVIGWIIGNTYEHYEEHIPWIEAIIGR